MQACLKQIDKHDDRLNTFIRLESELAQTQAEEFDKNRKRQSEIGLLGGVPLAHKDMYYRAGLSRHVEAKFDVIINQQPLPLRSSALLNQGR